MITPAYLARTGTEDGHQSAFFCFAGQRARGEVWAGFPPTCTEFEPDPRWDMLYSIPNGGHRDPATAARMKATGVKAGFPDIGLPLARGGFFSCIIEMKRPKLAGRSPGIVAPAQSAWHDALRDNGNFVAVCYGWEEAVECVTHYLNLPATKSAD